MLPFIHWLARICSAGSGRLFFTCYICEYQISKSHRFCLLSFADIVPYRTPETPNTFRNRYIRRGHEQHRPDRGTRKQKNDIPLPGTVFETETERGGVQKPRTKNRENAIKLRTEITPLLFTSLLFIMIRGGMRCRLLSRWHVHLA